MLRVGLTGGIGAGKSTVARTLAELGAVVIDADALARDVVAPGTVGLRRVAEAFGGAVLAGGSLDRAALARLVFADPAARARLEQITHPLIAEAARSAFAAAPGDAIVVHDVPLLVEKRMGADYHLVLVVDAPVAERVRRLVHERGISEDDARARIAAQADPVDRRAAADVWIDTDRPARRTRDDVERLWRTRLVPYAANLAARRRAERPEHVEVMPADPTWAVQAARATARIAAVAGSAVRRLDHVGSTAVPGLDAKDILDLQLVVDSLDVADRLRDGLEDKGFVRLPGEWWDDALDGSTPPKRLHGAADPGRAVNLHVRTADSPAVLEQLLLRDWLRAHPGEAAAYAGAKRAAAGGTTPGGIAIEAYLSAKAPWIRAALRRAQAWAARSGWAPGA